MAVGLADGSVVAVGTGVLSRVGVGSGPIGVEVSSSLSKTASRIAVETASRTNATASQDRQSVALRPGLTPPPFAPDLVGTPTD